MTARLAVCFGSFLLALLTSINDGPSAQSGRAQRRRSEARCSGSLLLSRAISLGSAPNSAGFSDSSGKLVLAGLVDTSGYAADLQAKYQGFLITEVKLSIEGTDLAPG